MMHPRNAQSWGWLLVLLQRPLGLLRLLLLWLLGGRRCLLWRLLLWLFRGPLHGQLLGRRGGLLLRCVGRLRRLLRTLL